MKYTGKDRKSLAGFWPGTVAEKYPLRMKLNGGNVLVAARHPGKLNDRNQSQAVGDIGGSTCRIRPIADIQMLPIRA